MDKWDVKSYFVFLDGLRESGAINMFGAAPVLSEEFEIEKNVARKALMAWMNTFSDKPMTVRVDAAMEFLSP